MLAAVARWEDEIAACIALIGGRPFCRFHFELNRSFHGLLHVTALPPSQHPARCIYGDLAWQVSSYVVLKSSLAVHI